jgi:hypothetical protein
MIERCAKRLKDWKTMPISARVAASSFPSCGKRLALDENLAGIDGLEAVDGAAKRRLARARRADNHDNLALANGG